MIESRVRDVKKERERDDGESDDGYRLLQNIFKYHRKLIQGTKIHSGQIIFTTSSFSFTHSLSHTLTHSLTLTHSHTSFLSFHTFLCKYSNINQFIHWESSCYTCLHTVCMYQKSWKQQLHLTFLFLPLLLTLQEIKSKIQMNLSGVST